MLYGGINLEGKGNVWFPLDPDPDPDPGPDTKVAEDFNPVD